MLSAYNPPFYTPRVSLCIDCHEACTILIRLWTTRKRRHQPHTICQSAIRHRPPYHERRRFALQFVSPDEPRCTKAYQRPVRRLAGEWNRASSRLMTAYHARVRLTKDKRAGWPSQFRRRVVRRGLDWIGRFNTSVAGHVMDHGHSTDLCNLPLDWYLHGVTRLLGAFIVHSRRGARALSELQRYQYFKVRKCIYFH